MVSPKAKRNQKGRVGQLPKGPNGGVQLLLVQTVENLGKPGDIVEVRRGYAVNYLLPQGLATVASDHHRRMVEKHKARLMEIERARMASLRSLANSIEELSVSIEANANEEGHLYGSVGAPEIVQALKKESITLKPDQIRLEGPLKELGLYTVKVHLGPEVDAELKVWVVPTVSEDSGATA